jgi:hypothetical protein
MPTHMLQQVVRRLVAWQCLWLMVWRVWPQTMPDPGPPNGAAQGRWRFRPPCTNTGPLAVGSPFLGNKGCTAPPGGIYTPPMR